MICQGQVMPGNDVHGGFATHVTVPGRGLCVVPGATDDFDAVLPAADGTPNPGGLTLRHLAVIADAVSTPYQAIARADLRPGDVAVVIGLGGVGGYAAQIARSKGAYVVAFDVDSQKIGHADAHGVHLALNANTLTARDARKRVLAFADEVGAPRTRWKILECSGTAPGQDLAWGLLVHGATLMVVGFTMAKVPLRLSNLMAFDARAVGNWGCDPSLYPEIVRMALAGELDLSSHTELRPLSHAAQALQDVRTHTTSRRLVLVP